MSGHEAIPDAVRRFILLGVPSVPYLEAMLLFRGEPQSALSASDVARRLYLPESTAWDLVRQLADARVIAGADGGWRYAADAELAALIDDLARVYAENLVGVAKLIHAKSDRRATQFADAFKIRKDS
jgi:hypothetical protein